VSRLRAGLAFTQASAAAEVRYRTALFTTVALILVQVFVLTHIWKALYGAHSQEDGLTVHATIVYLTVANLQTLIMSSSVAFFVAVRVRQGSVAADLARPVSFVGQLFAWHSGEAIVLVASGLVAVPVAMLVGGFGAPPQRRRRRSLRGRTGRWLAVERLYGHPPGVDRLLDRPNLASVCRRPLGRPVPRRRHRTPGFLPGPVADRRQCPTLPVPRVRARR
jgi:hypothetical protein